MEDRTTTLDQSKHFTLLAEATYDRHSGECIYDHYRVEVTPGTPIAFDCDPHTGHIGGIQTPSVVFDSPQAIDDYTKLLMEASDFMRISNHVREMAV